MTRARARCARAKNNTRWCVPSPPAHPACIYKLRCVRAFFKARPHTRVYQQKQQTRYIPFSLLKNNIYYYIIIAKAKILKKKLSSIFLWLIRVCYFHEKTILQKYLSQTIIITLILGSHSFENFKVITKYLSYSLNSNFRKFSFESLKNHKKVDFLRFSSNMVAIF